MELPMKVAKSSKDQNVENKDFIKPETENVVNIKEDIDRKNDDCMINDATLIKEEVQTLEKEANTACHCEKESNEKEEDLSDKEESPLRGGEDHQNPEEDSVSEMTEDRIPFLKKDAETEKNAGNKMNNHEEKDESESYPRIVKSHIRYDEWMKADKAIRPADKSVPKIKHRRKIKNKFEADHNKSKQDKDENCPKQCRLFSRPLFQPCDLDNELSFDSPEGRNTTQGPLKPLEITSILNGLQATENSADDNEIHQVCHNMHKNDTDFVNHKSDLAARAEGKNGQGIEDAYFRVDKKDDCRSKLEQESSDETDSELETPRRNKFVKDFVDKVNISLMKCSKRKFNECGKSLTPNIKDESIKCRETRDRFDVETLTSSDDEEEPKPKVPLIKKCNGLDDKKKSLRTAGFYTCLQEVPDKKTKINYSEERLRAKDRKDVWSSIQGQWPKKTLKELFSDSDTEGASSPPHRDVDDTSVDSTFPSVNETRDLSVEFLKPITDAIELKPADEKTAPFSETKVDFPSSGSNSVLNTPPTTPESTSSSREYRRPELTLENLENADASQEGTEANQEEVESMKSDTNSTIEVDSVTCELQDLQFEGNLSPTGFDASISSSSSNHLETECKEEGKQNPLEDSSNHVENCTLKKVKRSHKSSANQKRKIANTSDSEELSGGESLAKIHSSKLFSGLTSKHTKTSSGISSPGKYLKSKDRESCQKECNDSLPKIYKWSFQLADLENMTSVERITFLQEKLQELRKHYLSLKSEVASIDRRRKHSKKKEREGAILSTLSSSPSSSSVTAAVMLTLADPSLSASSQNALAVECR